MNLAALFDLSRWFDAFPEPPGPLYLVGVIGFTVWTVAGIGVYRYRRRIFAGRGPVIRVAALFGPWAIVIGVTVLLLLGARYASVPYVSMRFLFYLSLLSAIGFIGFLGYYRYRYYPELVARIRAAELKQRYAPIRKKKRRPTR